MLQIVADGLIIGSIISLGAIGLGLTLSIVRFSNFSHGELLGWGGYFALSALALFGAASDGMGTPIGPFSFGWAMLGALLIACVLTAVLALALDHALFRRLRRQGAITLVIASFGAALALRNLLLFWYGGVPQYYSQNLQISIPLVGRETLGGLRITPDQLFVLALSLVTVTALHLFLRHSTLGRSMRATAINPNLARVAGIDPERVLRATWIIGGILAAVAGVFAGITVQLRPTATMELGAYTGNLAVNGSNFAGLNVPYRFMLTSDGKGTLKIVGQNEFTYFTPERPNLAGVHIELTNPQTGAVVAEGETRSLADTTDPDHGTLILPNLPEGRYNVHGTAAIHGEFRSTVQVIAGETRIANAFLPRQFVTYTWNVVPVDTEDPYRVTLDTAFDKVLGHCSTAERPGQDGTWITPDMRRASIGSVRIAALPTTSGMLLALLPMTGVPQAMASNTGKPKPS